MTEYKILSENGLGPKNTQAVGENFTGSGKDLALIRKFLKVKKADAPDYLNHYAAAAEAMVKLGFAPYITVDAGEFFCEFTLAGLKLKTAPQPSATAAMTAALFVVAQAGLAPPPPPEPVVEEASAQADEDQSPVT